MSRTQRRVSRGLIAILVVVVVLGGVFYFHNTTKSAATTSANRPATDALPPITGSIPVVASSKLIAPPLTTSSPGASGPIASPATQPAAPRSDVLLSRTPDSNPPSGNSNSHHDALDSTPTTKPASAGGSAHAT